jgi:hypothetical protein
VTRRARAQGRRAGRIAAAALLAAAACHHENPSAPEPVLHAIDVSERALATAEDGPPAEFEVVLRSRPAAPVEVEVRSGDPAEGLVLAPGYALPAEARDLSFTPDDWDVPRRVTVHPVDDHVVDGTARYDVTLRVSYTEDPAYAAVPPVAIAVANADDDVSAIEVSTRALATRENGPPATLLVRLATVPTSGAVNVSVSSDSAADGLLGTGSCWAATQAITLSFGTSDWDAPQAVQVCPADDPYAQGGERIYRITLHAWGYVPQPDLPPDVVVTVTHADDDLAALVVDASEPLVTGENGATDGFTVRLATPPLADVVLPVTSGDPARGLVQTAFAGPDASVSLVFDGTNWNVPQLVTVVGREDAAAPTVGVDTPYAVRVGPAGGADPAYPSVAPRTLAALNLDDDVPRVGVDPAGPLTTSETGTGASFVLSVNPPPGPVVVRVTSGAPGEGLLVDPATGERREQVDVTFAPSDWAPREIVVVGQQDEVLDGDVAYVVTVAVVSGDAGYLALAPRGVRVTNTDDLAASVARAAYDPVLRVPACTSVAFGCGSGSLLEGRDGVVYYGTSLGETNAPNTLATAPSCPDGTYPYVRRSLDELKVYAADGSPLEEGKLVRIEARVSVYSVYYDALDLFVAADASAPAWTPVATLRPTAGGSQVLATTAVLPASMSGLEAIRGTWRYGGGPTPCSAYSLDESDDLVFAVSTAGAAARPPR